MSQSVPTNILIVYTMQGQLLNGVGPNGWELILWDVQNTPDMTGQFSGYFGQLQNITISSITQVSSPTTQLVIPTGPAGGDLSGNYPDPLVNSIQGVVITGVPGDGYILSALSSTAAMWIPATSGSFAAGGDLTGTDISQTVAKIQGVAISGSAAANKVLMASSSSAASWQPITIISGITVSGTPSSGQILSASSSSAATWVNAPSGTFTAGGDLSGSSTSQTVVGIRGIPITGTPASGGEFLANSGGTLNEWIRLTGDVSSSNSVPGTITVNALQGNAIQAATYGSGQNGYVLTWVNSAGQLQLQPANTSFTAAGDLSGSASTQTVIGLQGNHVESGTLGTSQDGYALIWSHSNSQWQPEQITNISGITISGVPTAGQYLVATNVNAADWQNAPSGTFVAGGDLFGTSTFQEVGSIQGVIISGTPVAGNSLVASSSSAAAWSTVTNISGVTVSNTLPTTGYVLTATSSATANWQAVPSGSFSAGGDLTGTSTNQTVAKVNGNPILNVPTTGRQFFMQNATNTGCVWGSLLGDVQASISGAVGTLQVLAINGVVVSGVPTNGQTIVATSGTAAAWATVGGGGGSFTAGGDLSGTSTSQSVISITGGAGAVPIATSGNILTWAAATTAPGLAQTAVSTASATAANMTIAAQSASGTTSIGGNLILQAGTGTSTNGIISIPTAQINNQIASNQGTTSNILHQTTTSSSAASAVTVFTIPSGSCAVVTVTITGRQAALAVNQTWVGKLYNNSGTVVVFKAFAPADSLDASTGVTTLPTLSVANSGANVQVTVTPNATFGSTSTSWTYVASAVMTS